MKRMIALILPLALLCGCKPAREDPQEKPAETPDAYSAAGAEVYAKIEGDFPAYFEYSYNSIGSERFAVANDGRFVRSQMRTSDVDLIEHTMDGESRRIGSYSSIPEAMAFMGNELYILGMRWGSGSSATGINLYKLNRETGKTELESSFDVCLRSGCAMSGNESELYIIGDAPVEAKAGIITGVIGADSMVFRIHNGEIEQLTVDNPTAVCARKTGGAVIAGRDDNGTYLTQYIDGELTERKYIDVTLIQNLSDVDGKLIAYTARKDMSSSVLCVTGLDEMCTAELIPDINVNGERLGTAGGYCFFEDIERTKEKDYAVIRVKISEYYRGNVPLDFICTGKSGEAPFSSGYMIKTAKLSGEEAALKILSRDKDYDVCYISTADPISYNLKTQGSFYPLNGIPGIREYLDKCFDGIKEAFTDENGDIWALPLVSETAYLFSDRDDLGFADMTFSDYADFLDNCGDGASGFYNLKRTFLDYQAAEIKSFDTPGFRTAAEKFLASDKLNILKKDRVIASGVNSFTVLPCDIALALADKKERYVCGLPCSDRGNVIIPDITFMCVNPDSKRLPDVLGYIEKAAEFQLTRPDKFIIAPENGVYTGSETVRMITELCRDETVYFSYPDDLYRDSFESYLSGDISLDDFIREADRKLQAYLNE